MIDMLDRKYNNDLLPPGHKVVAQSWDSVGFPEHVPLSCEGVVMSRLRNWTDPPHVTPQVDQDDQEPQTQFTWECNNKLLFVVDNIKTCFLIRVYFACNENFYVI